MSDDNTKPSPVNEARMIGDRRLGNVRINLFSDLRDIDNPRILGLIGRWNPQDKNLWTMEELAALKLVIEEVLETAPCIVESRLAPDYGSIVAEFRDHISDVKGNSAVSSSVTVAETDDTP